MSDAFTLLYIFGSTITAFWIGVFMERKYPSKKPNDDSPRREART